MPKWGPNFWIRPPRLPSPRPGARTLATSRVDLMSGSVLQMKAGRFKSTRGASAMLLIRGCPAWEGRTDCGVSEQVAVGDGEEGVSGSHLGGNAEGELLHLLPDVAQEGVRAP